nr:hypothetical protein HAGR004_41850 [Bdellovibrio sp. HAGR004]
MKKKEELVPFDYVRHQIGIEIKKMGKKVGLTNAIEVSFFTLGCILYEGDQANFKKWISLIKAGVKSNQKMRKKRQARKKKV